MAIGTATSGGEGGAAQGATGGARDRAWTALALTAILAVAAALRFDDLARTSLWNDEAASWLQANQSFIGMLQATARDNYPPLHNIILNLTIRLFGDGEVALRAPSALLGTATVWLLYRLGATLWDRTTGLIAALMLALSGYHVWYSTEARMYALLAFTATLYVLSVVRAVRREEPFAAAACAGAAVLLLYTHVYGAFVFIGVNLAVIGGILAGSPAIRIRWRHWLIWQAAAGLLFLPWAFLLLRRVRRVMQGFWIQDPTPEVLLATFSDLAGGGLALAALCALTFLAIVGRPALAAIFKGHTPLPLMRPDWHLALLGAWILVPFLLGYTISIVGQPILIARYLICILPALLLLSARGLVVLTVYRPLLPLSCAAFIAVAYPAVIHNAYERERQDDRTAVAAFAARFAPEDRVIFHRSFGRRVFSYYFRHPIPHSEDLDLAATPDLPGSPEQRVWYIRSNVGDDDAERVLTAFARDYDVVFFHDIGPRHAIHLFAPRASTP